MKLKLMFDNFLLQHAVLDDLLINSEFILKSEFRNSEYLLITLFCSCCRIHILILYICRCGRITPSLLPWFLFVLLQLLEDPEVQTKLKAQVLIYPALQALDLALPSYQDNAHKPILPRSLMVRFWSEYFSSEPALREAMASNSHVPAEASALWPLLNWSLWLPPDMRGAHRPSSPVWGSVELARRHPGLLDPRASPLLAGQARLSRLPPAFVLTCEHDVLRDDGVMYVGRLRAAGVPVTHHHAKDAFHGAMTFLTWPLELALGHRLFNTCLGWLKDNL